jgi:chemotaxis protein methyltransferase CheR
MTISCENQDAELDLLLDEVFARYHHDFRHYVRASLERRVSAAMSSLGIGSIRLLRQAVRRDPRAFAVLLGRMTIQVSELFRDPDYWRALRQQVLPRLATYPFLRVWIAGCGAGEEAYSMAILLAEAGLLERSQLYATDISAAALAEASAGAYELERMRSFSDNYFRAGGTGSLSDYYDTSAARARFREELGRRILFSDHSLATDGPFAEVQLVSCRNVLIYFDRTLQDRALGLFAEALCPHGFLGLGPKESLLFSAHTAEFEPVVPALRIHRKRARRS